MGAWGAGAMGNDTAMDLRGMAVEAYVGVAKKHLACEDDQSVFAAAHLLLELAGHDSLGPSVEFELFMAQDPPEQRLVDFMRIRVLRVEISGGWCDPGARQEVRLDLLRRIHELGVAEAGRMAPEKPTCGASS